MGKGAEWHNTQFYGLRSTKGNPARPLEAHHERQKEQYASNPDIDTSRSKYNFHIVKPEGRYYHFIQSRIEQAGCRTRKDSTRFVDTLITASPEFFKEKSQRRYRRFPAGGGLPHWPGRTGKYRVGGGTHGRENAPPAFDLCSADKGQPPVCKGDYRQPGKPDEVAGRFSRLHGGEISRLGAWESASKTGRKHIPTRLFKQAVSLSRQARAIEATLDGINPLNAGKKKRKPSPC